MVLMVLIHYGGSIGYWAQRYFLGRRNSTHCLICAGGWVLFVQLEKHKLNLECLTCVAYNAHHIIRLEFSTIGLGCVFRTQHFPVVQTTMKI